MSDAQTLQETQLRIERHIAAAPETVFDYWIKPELFASWFGPEGAEIPEYEIDPVVGGTWRITMITQNCDQKNVGGTFVSIERPSRLVFTWAWDNDDGTRGTETEVTVTFEGASGGTKLTLLQREFETAESAAMHDQGWSSSLDCLAAAIDGPNE